MVTPYAAISAARSTIDAGPLASTVFPAPREVTTARAEGQIAAEFFRAGLVSPAVIMHQDPLCGAMLGSYRVIKRIGRGGMSVVYEAEHPLIGRKVAIKLLLPELSKERRIVERFFHEAKSTAGLHHTGIVQVFDFGQHIDGRAYIVMELLGGVSLAMYLHKRGRIESALAMSLGRQLAAILSVAHAHRIIHRDLKPANIQLVTDKELACGMRAKVLDFGIAKLIGDSLLHGQGTQTGMLLGTPLYMSPEQCLDPSRVDGRSDIYSLGCILYEMVCGRPPFVRQGSGELIKAHTSETPPAPSSIEPGISSDLQRVILRALEKQPSDRQQSMEQLAHELDRLRPATSDTLRIRSGTAKRRVVFAVLSAASLGAAGWFLTHHGSHGQPAASVTEAGQVPVAPSTHPRFAPREVSHRSAPVKVAAPVEPETQELVQTPELAQFPERVSPEPDRMRALKPASKKSFKTAAPAGQVAPERPSARPLSDDGVLDPGE